MSGQIKVTFIGTGGSWPYLGRGLPAIILQIDDITILFDCAEGTQRKIMKYGISFMKIDHIFLTHLHGDHFLGLPGLIQSMSFNGRTKDLNIYVPENGASMIINSLSLGYYSLNFNIKIHELKDETEIIFPDFTVKSIRADHPVPALSYKIVENDLIKIDPEKARTLLLDHSLIETIRNKGYAEHNGRKIYLNEISAGIRPGRTFVYTGDTRPNPKMVDFAKNASLLVHESSTDSSFEPTVNQYGHTSARQAAEIARDAGVKKLFLFHYSPRIDDTSILLEDAKKIFENSFLSEDGLSVEIKKEETILNQ
ncbi:ribonuclease Z [Caldiplasma sukawensis]